MDDLLKEISGCTVCASALVLGPRPILAAHPKSKIIIIGQAPGAIVHRTGIPWDDKSGENLRNWMGIERETFYNPSQIAIIPIGFCYPGKGKTGDLPPRKECAPLWHTRLLQLMKAAELTLLIGKYAQDYYLRERSEKTLTATVKNYRTYLPDYFVLPHPSPRNNIWMAKNKWFGTEILPALKAKIEELLK